MIGRISFYLPKKYWGQIAIVDENGKDDLNKDTVFFHASAVINQKNIQINSRCTFDIGSYKARECAKNIVIEEAAPAEVQNESK